MLTLNHFISQSKSCISCTFESCVTDCFYRKTFLVFKNKYSRALKSVAIVFVGGVLRSEYGWTQQTFLYIYIEHTIDQVMQ